MLDFLYTIFASFCILVVIVVALYFMLTLFEDSSFDKKGYKISFKTKEICFLHGLIEERVSSLILKGRINTLLSDIDKELIDLYDRKLFLKKSFPTC